MSHCNTLQHTATQHTATHCNTLQHTATHCSRSLRYGTLNTLQHSATLCNSLFLSHTHTHLHVAGSCHAHGGGGRTRSTRPHVTHMNGSCHTYLNESRHTHEWAQRRRRKNTFCESFSKNWSLNHVSLGRLQHTATHCNTLQHNATHCNTLQHTATHCNCNTGRHSQKYS